MKKYFAPEFEMVVLDVEDIMVMSNLGEGDIGGGGIDETPVLPYGMDQGSVFSDE